MTALKSVLFLIFVAGLGAGYLPLVLLPRVPQVETGMLTYFAFPLWLIGAVIVLWCFADFTFKGHGTPNPIDPPKELVTTGAYRYTRNPIYVATLTIIIGHFLWFKAIWMLIYAAVVFLFFHLFVTLYEEPKLKEKFGAAYENYCKSIPRWLPKLK
jgi:protein-S-isoprenylcysteine O-methyltransferase Ste14